MGKRRDTYILNHRPDDCPHCDKPIAGNHVKTGAHNGGTGAWKVYCQRCGMVYYDITHGADSGKTTRQDPQIRYRPQRREVQNL